MTTDPERTLIASEPPHFFKKKNKNIFAPLQEAVAPQNSQENAGGIVQCQVRTVNVHVRL